MYQDIIETYRKLYDLPELVHTEKVSFDFFRLCRRDYKFIVICIYNERREILLFRDLNKNIGWEIVGGYLEKNEKLEDGVNRIVFKETGLSIDELQPIALVNNNFKNNGNTISHFGIAFIALAQGKIKPQPENIKIVYTKEIPDKAAYQNKKILQIARQKVESKNFEVPHEEIESSKKFIFPHLVNKYFVRNIFGRIASKQIHEKILEMVSDEPKTMIDVACGDDDFIFKLEKTYHPEICLANDISWKLISLIKNKDKKGNILFTNHNALDLPFVRKFDLVLFKNTFHHIQPDLQVNLIKKLAGLAKQLIVVDIEDPKRSNFLARIWNLYYVYLLGDKGNYFLTYKKFKEIIENNIKGKKTAFGIINTIKGRYFYASLLDEVQQQRGEEVEVKIKIEPAQTESVKRELFKLGALFKEKIKEEDLYFTAPHRDFIKTKECLRIRERNGYSELTYKGPTTELMGDKKQFWKKEVNMPLSDSSKKEAEKLLELLSFKKVAKVVKERERFTLGKQEITIDNVKDAGWFVEIESFVTSEKERNEALVNNISLLKKLGLYEKNIVAQPYRDLVLENFKEKS